MKSVLTTSFASVERSTDEELHRQSGLIKHLPQVISFLDALPTLALVVNQHRQIVFANRAFLQLVKVHEVEQIAGQRHGEVLECIRATVAGQRPGEAVDCIHATQNLEGCGTTMFCKTCGEQHPRVDEMDELLDLAGDTFACENCGTEVQ